MRFSLCLLALWLAAACSQQRPTLTEADRSAVADTVKRIVTGVFAAASRRDAAGFVSAFAPDSDLQLPLPADRFRLRGAPALARRDRPRRFR